MTPFRYIVASLRHHRRIHVAVALGVAVATAVLTGALLVGDSVRGSLRDLTLQRLGRIDSALVTGYFFREALADELAADAQFEQHFTSAEPAILIGGTLQAGSGVDSRRATSISVVGCRPTFWTLGQGGPAAPLVEDQLAITEALARELDVQVGDELLLRIPIAGAIPSDSPLGEKSDTSLARRLKVEAVLPPHGLARFGIVPSQHLPRNVFVPLATLQDLVGKSGSANAIFVASDRKDQAADKAAQHALRQAFRPRLTDFGVRIEHVAAPTEYLQISADQLVLPDAVVRAAERTFGKERLQPVITYLANTLVVGDGESQRKIPYSTITGVDSTAKLGPLLDESGQPIALGDDEIVLNRWAADDLQAQIGDEITVNYYEPESTHGRLREHHPPPTFKLRAIVDLATADGEPTPAADPSLTPELPGVTDQKSINDWDLPFELVEKIRPEDEEYWDKYRATPKAFVSLATAKRLWPSRWGTISLLRLPAGSLRTRGSTDHSIAMYDAWSAADQLASEIDPAALGMTFVLVKSLGLDASSGTTPFDFLFLGFSFFLIAAAVMLITLLFQLGIQQRTTELGTLAAAGLAKPRIARLLSGEGLFVSAIGAAIGVAFGVFYAWAMVTGLRTWWVAAIATPFLELHVTARSLAVGGLAGLVTCWLTIRWCIARLVRQPAAHLLSGATAGGPRPPVNRPRRPAAWPILRIVLAVLTFALVLLAFQLQSEAQAGAFFASGAAMLILLLGEIRHRLRRLQRTNTTSRSFSLAGLSALNTARNPTRSALTVGLVSAATFLIVAISAFRLESGDAGTGGFDFVAISDLPIHFDLDSSDGRLELGFPDPANKQLENWRIYSLRVAGGEDASCLNLYQTTQPRVLGVPPALIERGGFAWSAVADRETPNPWKLLDRDVGQDEHGRAIVPVVLDASTATYSLHLRGVGARYTIRDAVDQPLTLQVVGLLKNSVLQGNLLVSEANFLQRFPDVGGYRYFLVEDLGDIQHSATADGTRSVSATLESTLADFGFDAVDAHEQLAAYLAVQNTYLSTFQSLGALGLLLGTLGLAAVQWRSVLERRGELALMRAAGFPPNRLTRMVVWENAVLLVGGLLVGCLAAFVALIPQWAPHDAAIPWLELAVLLAIIAAVGMVVGWLATRSALRAPLLPALRGE